VDAAKVREWLDNALFSADQAKAAGLIDAVEQRQDFETLLKDRHGKDVVFDRKYGRKTQPDVDLSSPFALFKVFGELVRGPKKGAEARPAIGIVYVDGPIMTGRGTSNPFGGSLGAFSTTVREALDKAAEDDSIKAVVLRVNSPGGSVTASEIILDATKRVKAKKPFVVSMGDVAGSGGYYVACASDTIFADRATITASIGVVVGKLVTTDLWNNVGINWKGYKRGTHSALLGSAATFSDEERKHLGLAPIRNPHSDGGPHEQQQCINDRTGNDTEHINMMRRIGREIDRRQSARKKHLRIVAQ
jgi:protease-4